MRWDIEPPTQEQIDQLVQEARQQGREFATLELVARLGAPAPSPAAAATTPPAAKPGAAAPAAGAPAAATATGAAAVTPHFSSSFLTRSAASMTVNLLNSSTRFPMSAI